MTTLNTTGTISLTNGSAIVTGSGTNWAIAGIVAGTLYVQGAAYPIVSVESDVSLTLAIPFAGTTGSGLAYAISIEQQILASTTANANRLAAILDQLTPLSGITTYSYQLLENANAAAWRSSMGLGTVATQSASAVSLTGGNITAVAFTNGSISGTAWTGGSINGAPIGATTRDTGNFTTLSSLVGDGAYGVFVSGASYAVRMGAIIGSGYAIEAVSSANSTFEKLMLGGNSVEFTTFGAARMTIDSAGRVTMPAQPVFQAVRSSASHQTANGVIEFGAAILNVGGHYSIGTSRFTAPVPGVYRFTVNLLIHLPNAFSYASGQFHKNGAPQGSIWISPSAAIVLTICMVPADIAIYLAAGDYIDIRMTDSGGGGGIYLGSYSSFVGELIS